MEIVREAEEYLAAVATRLKEHGTNRVETSVWYAPAASAIVEAARLKNTDLIVMSTHGRSGLGRLILGSVAESVLRGTTIPILLLRVPNVAFDHHGVESPAQKRLRAPCHSRVDARPKGLCTWYPGGTQAGRLRRISTASAPSAERW